MTKKSSSKSTIKTKTQEGKKDEAREKRKKKAR